jgi:hypothetical protein
MAAASRNDKGREVLDWLQQWQRVENKHMPTGLQVGLSYLACTDAAEVELWDEAIDFVPEFDYYLPSVLTPDGRGQPVPTRMAGAFCLTERGRP